VATVNLAKEPPMQGSVESVQNALFERFGERIAVNAKLPGRDELARLAGRSVHRRFADRDILPGLLRLLCACAQIDAYDRRRARSRPCRNQRDPARFGRAEFYGWSEDKARQYAAPLRADFGAFVSAQGFHLD
jgi:hypothetical protein